MWVIIIMRYIRNVLSSPIIITLLHLDADSIISAVSRFRCLSSISLETLFVDFGDDSRTVGHL